MLLLFVLVVDQLYSHHGRVSAKSDTIKTSAYDLEMSQLQITEQPIRWHHEEETYKKTDTDLLMSTNKNKIKVNQSALFH